MMTAMAREAESPRTYMEDKAKKGLERVGVLLCGIVSGGQRVGHTGGYMLLLPWLWTMGQGGRRDGKEGQTRDV